MKKDPIDPAAARTQGSGRDIVHAQPMLARLRLAALAVGLSPLSCLDVPPPDADGADVDVDTGDTTVADGPAGAGDDGPDDPGDDGADDGGGGDFDKFDIGGGGGPGDAETDGSSDSGSTGDGSGSDGTAGTTSSDSGTDGDEESGTTEGSSSSSGG